MSKMSELHAELSEQAAELGFEDLGEAEQAGYGVDWENAKLIPPEEAAHMEWLKEKEEVLNDLEFLKKIETTAEQICGENIMYDAVGKLDHAIEFVKGIKHE